MNIPQLPDIVGEDFKNEWREMPEADYHKDLSAVARGDILAFLKSPASLLGRRRREENDEPSEALKFGRAAHMLALEPEKFRKTYVLMPEFIGLTKDGKESKRSAEAIAKKEKWLADLPPGTEPLTEEDLFNLNGICEALLKHQDTRGIFEGGILENIGYYRDPATGLKGRVKPDCIQPELEMLIDFKTTREGGPDEFANVIARTRLDIQLVKYSVATKAIMGLEPKNRGWVCVEKTDPWEPAFYRADERMLQVGQEDYRRAMDGIAECLAKGEWPFRQKALQPIDFPQWFYYRRGDFA